MEIIGCALSRILPIGYSMNKNYIPLLLLCILGFHLSAEGVVTDSVRVSFRQSHIEIDPSYKENGHHLDSIFKRLDPDSSATAIYQLRNVRVIGGASPEGSVKFNQYLSENRAKALFDLFRNRGLADESTTDFTFLGRDWQGLRDEVSRDSDVPYRDEVLSLIDEILSPSSSLPHPLASLKGLRGGAPYRYMYSVIFPRLRESRLRLDYDLHFPKVETSVPVNPLEEASLVPDIPPVIDHIELIGLGSVKKCHPFYMGLKTNLLFDALLLPNIGAEFYVGKGWSLTGDWMYGWWDRDKSHYYWRAYGGTLGVRKWFGRKAVEKPLTGHHLGLYAGVVTYDFELGGKGYMGGLPHETLWDRCNYVAGIEYGYSLPVARRLNIDFTIGFGYLGGKYLEYIPKDGFYMWQATRRLNWVGPTKAEISLVWLIGCGNYNNTKGGRK